MELERYDATDFGAPRRTGGRHGYVAYFPNGIPRTLDLPASTIRLLADAEGSLGRLAGIGRLLPNPDLLISPYLLREALSSTRIEGTQASMAEVLESGASGEAANADVEEVLNYVAAMNSGIKRLQELPMSIRLLREIHEQLMAGVRGKDLSPGAVRTSQNWIGPATSTIESAFYVPPPPEELPDLLSDWEKFANEDAELPLLVQDGLLHAQFETIHPFLDGNGRLGRLIIVFFLVARGRLPAPLLYLSAYLEANRDSYYDALQAIRENGDSIPWLELFLTAVCTQANDAVDRADKIVDIRERYRHKVAAMSSPNSQGLVELIAATPIVTAKSVETRLDVSRPTALRLLKNLEDLEILVETRAGARGQRKYVAWEMMEAVSADPAGEAPA